MRKLAWMTAHLLQPYAKKGHTISPKMLLGEFEEDLTVEEATERAYQKQAERKARGDS